MSLFKTLHAALSLTDELTLRVTAVDQDRMRVTLIPRLGDPDKAENEKGLAADLRAALSTPLTVCASPDALDVEFLPMLREYAMQRVTLCNAVTTLEGLKAANQKAEKAIKKKTGSAKEGDPKGDAGAADGKTGAATPRSDDDILL